MKNLMIKGRGGTSDEDKDVALRVKKIHINSAILAGKSQFFRKLFSNGMRESDPLYIGTVRIDSSEEANFMELLCFMYGGKLSSTMTKSFVALLDLMFLADKFDVISCVGVCGQFLCYFPMTMESALRYLEIPPHILMRRGIQSLVEKAREFLVSHYKDLMKREDDLMNLPIVALEAILSRDDIQVTSENMVYEIVLKWARVRYPKQDDRRAALGEWITHLVRFPYMSSQKLRDVLSCEDLDHDIAKDIVNDALLFKAEPLYRKRELSMLSNPTSDRRFIERTYANKRVKVVESDQPRPSCIVYLDLTRQECSKILTLDRICSDEFHLKQQPFFIVAANTGTQDSSVRFGVFLKMEETLLSRITVEMEIACRKKPEGGFVFISKMKHTVTNKGEWGFFDLFNTPWESFISQNSLFFIDNMLHLRAELTVHE
ncbi:BTB/POZ domain-containing protein POB1 [Acorus calamus]|uniref:BTB/POZ domain-containing protein POB1 n=1 Tax=Acorus calamus TaxID=4465 RepID=A0AAV9CCD9_ACOCL|nr:BTB/POZ domain-containing protein POB1 [Acorus calamus]